MSLAPANPVTLTFMPGGGFVSEQAPLSHSHLELAEESFPSVNFGSFIGPGAGWGLFAGDQGDPLMSGRYGGYWPADRVQLPNHAPSGFFTEVQLRIAISWSRLLCERNPLAIGFLADITTFIGPMKTQFVRDDPDPGSVSAGTGEGDTPETEEDGLVKRVLHLWERWCRASDWGRGIEDREKECRTRLMRDGNVILRLGGGKERNGYLPWIRFVEPEQIREPTGRIPHVEGYDPDELDWRWGVCTLKGDAETVIGYWICDQDDSGSGEFVPAEAIIRAKSNVDRTIKCGVPDMYPVEQHLQEALGIIANAGASSREQSSVAWLEQYSNATADQLRTLLAKGPEAYSRAGTGAVPAKLAGTGALRFPVKTYGTTRVIHADQNKEFNPGPTSTGVPSFVQMVEATLKVVGLRWGIQDWFGKGGSFAGELVEGSNLVRHTEDRQKQQIGITEALAMKVIELCEASGLLPPGATAAVKPVVTAKPVVIADEEKKVRTDLALLDKGVADPYEIMKKRGSDPKILTANRAKFKAELAKEAQAAQPQPQPGGPVQALSLDPSSTPPGSAGGDGSSPTEDPLGSLFDPAPARESGRGGPVAEEGPPPFPGAVLTGDPPRWHNPSKSNQPSAAHSLTHAPVVPPRAPKHPQTAQAARVVSVAHRRRVLAAFKSEAELSSAIQGHNLPDSEPADVVHLLDPDGRSITDPDHIKKSLRQRASAVAALSTGKYPGTGTPLTDEARASYERVLAQPAQFFEVKTLLTSSVNVVRMSKKAMARKHRWIARYGITFHTVVIDNRKGAKYSGHRVYAIANAFGGTVRLDQLERVPDMASVLPAVTK